MKVHYNDHEEKMKDKNNKHEEIMNDKKYAFELEKLRLEAELERLKNNNIPQKSEETANSSNFNFNKNNMFYPFNQNMMFYPPNMMMNTQINKPMMNDNNYQQK